MRRTLFPIILLVLAAGARAELEQVFVPQDFATIQAAADAVTSQQELVIASGTYAESVTFTGKSFVNITCKGKVVIAPPAGNGITFQDCDHFFIQNLRVKGGTVGIQLTDSEQLTFYKGGVDGSTEDGIRVEGGHGHQLQQLTIKDAGGDAINLAVGSKNFTEANLIVTCKLINPALDGVGINGSDNHIDLCKIVGAQRHGVFIDKSSPSTNSFIQDTKITKPVQNGIDSHDSATHVVGCKVTAPGGIGLNLAEGTTGWVQFSTFSKCGDHGIALIGNGFEVDECKVVKPVGDGILLAGSQQNVHDCKVLGAGVHGYEITTNNSTLTANLSGKAKGDGFRLGGMGNTLSTNTAKGSKGFDLDNLAPNDNTVDDDNVFKTLGP